MNTKKPIEIWLPADSCKLVTHFGLSGHFEFKGLVGKIAHKMGYDLTDRPQSRAFYRLLARSAAWVNKLEGKSTRVDSATLEDEDHQRANNIETLLAFARRCFTRDEFPGVNVSIVGEVCVEHMKPHDDELCCTIDRAAADVKKPGPVRLFTCLRCARDSVVENWDLRLMLTVIPKSIKILKIVQARLLPLEELGERERKFLRDAGVANPPTVDECRRVILAEAFGIADGASIAESDARLNRFVERVFRGVLVRSDAGDSDPDPTPRPKRRRGTPKARSTPRLAPKPRPGRAARRKREK